MAAINTTQELAKIRSKIDIQQQIISQLELELQMSILGDTTLDNGVTTKTVESVVNEVSSYYRAAPDGSVLEASFKEGVYSGFDKNNMIDQTSLRQMLYQARAMLGELRIEEQHWNEEVKEEKARRKELLDFAKG
jgi:hypothetical protein